MAFAKHTKSMAAVLLVLVLVVSLAAIYTLLPLILVLAAAFGVFSSEPQAGGISAVAGGFSSGFLFKGLLVIAIVFIMFFVLRRRSRTIRLP